MYNIEISPLLSSVNEGVRELDSYTVWSVLMIFL